MKKGVRGGQKMKLMDGVLKEGKILLRLHRTLHPKLNYIVQVRNRVKAV